MSEWIKPGETVFVTSGGYRDTRMTPATVDRLTTTQIVLTDGSRFNRRTLEKVGARGGSAWATVPRLRNPSDPVVAQEYRRQLAHGIRARAESKAAALLTLWRTHDDDGAAREALDLIGRALNRLDGADEWAVSDAQ